MQSFENIERQLNFENLFNDNLARKIADTKITDLA